MWLCAALCFVSDYHPGAVTLHSRYFGSHKPVRESEEVLWGYITQLLSALSAVHAAKLAARGIELHRVLLTDHNRIRLSWCGLLDALAVRPPHKSLPELQVTIHLMPLPLLPTIIFSLF